MDKPNPGLTALFVDAFRQQTEPQKEVTSEKTEERDPEVVAGITTNLYADTSKSKVSLKLLSGKSELYTSYIDDQGQSPERQVISGYGYSINKESKITQFFRWNSEENDDCWERNKAQPKESCPQCSLCIRG